MIDYIDPITDRVKGDASEIKWVCGVAAQKGAGPCQPPPHHLLKFYHVVVKCFKKEPE